MNLLDDMNLAQESFAYRDLVGIDEWTEWAPIRSGWTDIGTPAVTGRFRKVGKQCFFQGKVVPGTTTATAGGTSYIALPFAAKGLSGDGSMMNTSTLVAVGVGTIDVANSRFYVPTQAATANVLTFAGWFEV